MKRKYVIFLLPLLVIIGSLCFFKKTAQEKPKTESEKISATVLAKTDDEIIVQDSNQLIYTFSNQNINANVGDFLAIEYTGLLDKNKSVQDSTIIKAAAITDHVLPTEWQEEGMLKNYFNLAYQKLQKLTLDERIGELLLVRYPEKDTAIKDLKEYHFSGFVFYEKDFKNKTEQEVKNEIKELQNNAKIPLLTAVDEEGGKVIRVSSNPNLVAEPFKSSQELYKEGGFPKIREDTIEKSKILYRLGLNLNLAPVVDVSTNSTDYIYERSFGKDTSATSTYAKTVIEASKGHGVSYTLKHFPGYGNNADTHTSSNNDERSYEDIINNDLPPFEEGIKAGAEAVLVGHNTVKNIDSLNPASLSASIHNILRNRLDFSGIIITDDLDMGATSSIEDNAVKALLAGNDLLITTDYKKSFNSIKSALNSETISKDLIDRVALRVLAWKYQKGLIVDTEK